MEVFAWTGLKWKIKLFWNELNLISISASLFFCLQVEPVYESYGDPEEINSNSDNHDKNDNSIDNEYCNYIFCKLIDTEKTASYF